MLFSILIPVYNTQNFLPACLESLDAQEFKDFEVILVNDGSTDASPSICEEFAAQHENAHVINQENKGLLLARRAAFGKAAGDYCVCLDSDDALSPHFLAKCADVIAKTSADIVMVSYSTKEDFSGEPKCETFQPGLNDAATIKRAASIGLGFELCGKIIRRACIDVLADYSQYRGLTFSEDWLQFLPIATKAQSLFYIPESLYFYRQHESSSTACYRKDHLTSILQTCERQKEQTRTWGEEYIEYGKIARRKQIFNLLVNLHDAKLSADETRVEQERIREVLPDFAPGDTSKPVSVVDRFACKQIRALEKGAYSKLNRITALASALRKLGN